MEFIYTVNPDSDNPIMLINQEIGGNGIDGAVFQKELMYLDTLEKESIDIFINSVGGSVVEGLSICSAILSAKTPINTVNVGVAASIAGVIFMTAKNRIMYDYSLFMIHAVSGGSDEGREPIENALSMILSSKSNLTKEMVKSLMEVETWINAEEALSKGFATNIPDFEDVVFSEETNDYNDIYSFANKKIINMTENTEVKEVEIIDEVKDIENVEDVQTIEDVSETKEDLIEDDQKEIIEDVIVSEDAVVVNSLTNKVNEYELKIKELEDKLGAIERDKEMANKIKLIDDAIADGKIEVESKDVWVNLAVADFNNTKQVISKLSINKTAPRMEFENKAEKSSSFMDFFNHNKNKK